MERTRPAGPAQDSGFEPLAAPAFGSLRELLEAVRSPAVLRVEVDALFRGLASPLAEGESPRARADLLLSVIESSDVGDLSGSEKVTLRGAAVKALLELGYPYALELPPEALELAHEARREQGAQQVPVVGLCALGIALLIQLFYTIPGVAGLLSKNNPAVGAALIALTAVLGPAAAAVFGASERVRWLQRLGVVTVTITGSCWLVGFLMMMVNLDQPFTRPATWAALTAGLGFLLGALLTRRPSWLREEQVPKGPPSDG